MAEARVYGVDAVDRVFLTKADAEQKYVTLADGRYMRQDGDDPYLKQSEIYRDYAPKSQFAAFRDESDGRYVGKHAWDTSIKPDLVTKAELAEAIKNAGGGGGGGGLTLVDNGDGTVTVA